MAKYITTEEEIEFERLRALEKEAEKYCKTLITHTPCFAKHLKPKSSRPTGEDLHEHWTDRNEGRKSPLTIPNGEAHTAIFLLERLREDFRENPHPSGSMFNHVGDWIAAYRKEIEND